MANFFNLTLDTLAPIINGFTVNNGAVVTTSPNVTLQIDSADASAMKIWGIADAATEEEASWITFANSKSVSLPSSADGNYTIHIKVRDSVYNESDASSVSITLSTALPNITITGPDVSVISEIDGKNTAMFSFISDVAISEWKVKLVPASNSPESSGTQIGMVNGSTNMAGGSLAASTSKECSINGTDFSIAAGGTDGTYIVKVFGKNAENNLWSA